MTANNRLIQGAMLLLWAFASARSDFSNRVSGPWLHYDFLRDECLSGEIAPSSVSAYNNWFGGLHVANTETVVCPNGNGIMGSSGNPQLERVISNEASDNEFTNLLENSATGLSLEIWFDAVDHVTPDENHIILAITLSDPANEPAYPRNVFMVVEDGDNYKVLDNFESGEVNVWRFRDIAVKPTSPHHFLYTILYDYLPDDIDFCSTLPPPTSCQRHILYINGNAVSSETVVSTNLPPNNAQKIRLFSDPTNLPTFAPSSGTIYMMAMYGQYLDAVEVQQNYEAKLMNSAPVNFDSTFIVPEDGEIDGYSIIVIPDYVDVDEDPEHPNYNSGDSSTTLFVTSLPTKGGLFDINGNPITNDDLPFAVGAGDGNSLRYSPLGNEWSGMDNIYTSFQYIYKDGVDPSLESKIASASIYVTPKDDQVVAIAGVSVAIRGLSSDVCVEAHDVDDGDNVAGIVLASAPQLGTLYQLDSSGNVDTEKPISTDASWDNLFCASYLYTGDAYIPAEGIMGFDTFTFKAYNTATPPDYSLETTVTLNIYEGLLAGDGTGTTKSVDAHEDTVTSITIHGSDATQIGRSITFVIMTVPTNGTLIDPSTESPITIKGESLSTTLVPPYDGGIEIQYVPLKDHFSSDITDIFSYYVAATENMESKSKEVSVIVNIINVNDPPDPLQLSCPDSYYLTPTADDEKIHEVILTNFGMHDTNLNVDMVRMVISASYGSLTLNQEFANDVDFSSSAICFGQEKWTCEGTGYSDSRMSFVGYPTEILKAIDGMTYVASETGKVDKISLTVYDGAGDNCISNQDQEGSSVRTECFSSTCTFDVLISPQGGGGDANDNGDGTDSDKSGFKMRNIPLYAWLLIFGGAIALCSCFCVRRRMTPQPPPPLYIPPPPHYATPVPYHYPEPQSPKEYTTMIKKTEGHSYPTNDNRNNNTDEINYYDHYEKGSNSGGEAQTECPSPLSQSDSPLKKVCSRSSSSG